MSLGIRHCLRRYSEQSVPRKYIPRRAVMYAPGDDMKKLRKLTTLGVDCAVFDCEDGVAMNRKDDARRTIVDALCRVDEGRTDVGVRINSVGSGLAGDDVAHIFSLALPRTIYLPKVGGSDDILWLHERLLNVCPVGTKLKLIFYTETSKGLMNLKHTLRTAAELSEQPECRFTLEGVVFGADDYCADVGAVRSDDSLEVVYARQKVICCAKSHGLHAIDLVNINYKDPDALRKECDQGFAWGFTGKQVIHPSQVAVVHSCFLPSEAAVTYSRELMDAFKQQQNDGRGAFGFRGKMIDMPTLKIAENIVELVASVTDS